MIKIPHFLLLKNTSSNVVGVTNLDSNSHKVQFYKFLLVGLLNTAIGYAIFVLFSSMGLATSIALAFTYIFGVISNFFTTGNLVFGVSNISYFFRFIIVYVAVYFINLLGLSALIDTGINKLLAQAILIPFMALVSFWAFKIFVFRKL